MSLFNEAIRLGFAVTALLLVAMLTSQPGQSKISSQSPFRQIASAEPTQPSFTKKEEKQKPSERKKKKTSKRVGSSYEHREDLN
ncbi:MAG: hypothetical protein ACK5RO_04330 [Pseudobdellovibrionaceae bacterium]